MKTVGRACGRQEGAEDEQGAEVKVIAPPKQPPGGSAEKPTGPKEARAGGGEGGERCLQRSSSPAAASNCTSLSHIDLISSCLASCAQGLWDDWKQKMHCSVIGLPLNKARHMTTLTYAVTVSLAPLIVRATDN